MGAGMQLCHLSVAAHDSRFPAGRRCRTVLLQSLYGSWDADQRGRYRAFRRSAFGICAGTSATTIQPDEVMSPQAKKRVSPADEDLDMIEVMEEDADGQMVVVKKRQKSFRPKAGGCHCYLVAIVAGLGPFAIIIGSVIVA